MLIHKSFSRNDIIDIIILLKLKIIYSNQDNKLSIQSKIIKYISEQNEIIFADNIYKIKSNTDLKLFLESKNKNKKLTIRERRDVMLIVKCLLNFCKTNFDLVASSRYDSLKDIEDDLDYIRQFGEIPSVRRVCRLINGCPYFDRRFIPIIPPDIQKQLNDKILGSRSLFIPIKIRRSTPDNPIVVVFD